jgi:exodeoxyribonuclease VII large subunit
VDRYSPEDRETAGLEQQNDGLAREILTVSQLNRVVAGLLERSMRWVWVSGEISNFTRAASGHWYFTLKDAGAQVRAVMFRARAQLVSFAPREGFKVDVRALASMYEARGEFQLNVEAMRQAGAGDLFQRFLQLKERLQREGLFDVERKRPLPAAPRTIGVVTSPQAAALRDVLTTLARRAPHVRVIIYPTPVQGVDAPGGLNAALLAAARRAECDVLLLVRGGGSIEDLWAFNDETLAHTIRSSPIPIVSGVGHETDFTIADFVADQRAPTPTGAATMVVMDRREHLAAAAALSRQLLRAAARNLQRHEQRLDGAARLLRSPSAQWQQRAVAIDAVIQRLATAWRVRSDRASARLAHGRARIRRPSVELDRRQLLAARDRMVRHMGLELERCFDATERTQRRLAMASPEQLLSRGYAIVRATDGTVIRDAAGVAIGDTVGLLLGSGELTARVTGRKERP